MGRSGRGVRRTPRGRRWEPLEPLRMRQHLLPPLAFGEHVRVSFAVGRGGFLIRTIFRVRVVGAHVVILPRTRIMLTFYEASSNISLA